jgi:hypothetical protein
MPLPPLLLLALFLRGCIVSTCYLPAAAISAFGIEVFGLQESVTHRHGHMS